MQTTILICFKGDIFKVNLQFLCVFLDIKREAQNLFFFLRRVELVNKPLPELSH